MWRFVTFCMTQVKVWSKLEKSQIFLLKRGNFGKERKIWEIKPIIALAKALYKGPVSLDKAFWSNVKKQKLFAAFTHLVILFLQFLTKNRPNQVNILSTRHNFFFCNWYLVGFLWKKLEITKKKQEIIGKPGYYIVDSLYVIENVQRILSVVTKIKLWFIKDPKKKG